MWKFFRITRLKHLEICDKLIQNPRQQVNPLYYVQRGNANRPASLTTTDAGGRRMRGGALSELVPSTTDVLSALRAGSEQSRRACPERSRRAVSGLGWSSGLRCYRLVG